MISPSYAGFPEAINAAFPDAMVQTCTVHLVRHRLNFCSWQEVVPLFALDLAIRKVACTTNAIESRFTDHPRCSLQTRHALRSKPVPLMGQVNIAHACCAFIMRIYCPEIWRMIMAQSGRRAANLSLDQSLLSDARALGINLSRAAEAGLRQAVHEARAERWRQENAEALAASNAWVDEKGLPLAAYRPF